MSHFFPATANDAFIEISHDVSTHIATQDFVVLGIGSRAHIAVDSIWREFGPAAIATC
jgi:hypothetical protein